MRAAKRLITSRGEVAAGDLLPDDLEEGEVERLEDLGALKRGERIDGDAQAAARAALIAEAIKALPEDGFTESGKPSVDAINGNLPEDAEPVTAAERDAVWAPMAARAEAIADAIEALSDDEFAEDGSPDVDAINARLPADAEPVTEAERDAVWDRMEEPGA